MMLRLVASLCCAILSAQVFAFPCYFTLAKDSCWTDYDVKVVIIDANTNKQLLTVDVPKGKSWTRQTFNCQPAQKLMYQATFQPTIWQSDIGKTYRALRYWSMPGAIGANDTAWDIPVCFPAAFAAVPLPPTADANCQCNFINIPPIKPQ